MLDIDNDDLFASEEETLGGLEDEFGTSFFIVLRNFELNSSKLKAAHVEILRDRVLPFIQKPVGFAEIYGMTDRSGSRQVNYRISDLRVRAVQDSLLELGAPAAKVKHRFAKAVGEDFFEDRHAREDGDVFFSDGLKKPGLRVCVIGLSPAPIGVPTRIFRSTIAADTLGFCRLHRRVA